VTDKETAPRRACDLSEVNQLSGPVVTSLPSLWSSHTGLLDTSPWAYILKDFAYQTKCICYIIGSIYTD
jgi:hypothetical protein